MIKSLDDPGFLFGVNYWASHAGLFMWQKWDPAVVESDFQLMKKYRVQFLRVFPLWPDFQPLQAMRGLHGEVMEYRLHEKSIESGLYDPAAYLSATMLDRFGQLLALAEKFELPVNIALLNGWMSGRLFVPPALEGLNPITDPVALMWENRFIKGFVRRFAGNPMIIGWDPGNESNCMGTASREEAWVWLSQMCSAIRQEDPDTPILSGMHGLSLDGSWRIQDQGELLDVLTTHPYSDFVPYCSLEGASSFRTIMHPAAESVYYGDISGKPVLCQETNSLGPNLADQKTEAQFASAASALLWAYGSKGIAWWCGFDQNRITKAPYDWNALERELGLFTVDGEAKETVRTLHHVFAEIADSEIHGIVDRGKRIRDCYCILTKGQDHWGVAFSSFLLAAQAGREMKFGFIDEPLPDYPVYFLPSLCGYEPIPRRRWEELKKKIHDGAVLYLSLHDGFVSEFEELFGMRIVHRETWNKPVQFEIPSTGYGPYSTLFPVSFRRNFVLTGATVMGSEDGGNPFFTAYQYGKGMVFFLSFPLELAALEVPGFFDHEKDGVYPWYRIYERIFSRTRSDRIIQRTNPYLIVTEMRGEDKSRVAILVNTSDEDIQDVISINKGYQLDTVRMGEVISKEQENFTLIVKRRSYAICFLSPVESREDNDE